MCITGFADALHVESCSLAKRFHFLVSCEHGGNRIPDEYHDIFQGLGKTVGSHSGYDPGALDLARWLSETLEAELHFSEISRLLVDLNRSLHHRAVFSRFTKNLPAPEKKIILQKYYFSYRLAVEQSISSCIKDGNILVHLSVHSFTPVLHGAVRKADIALLYDPSRLLEKKLCAQWKKSLAARLPDLTLRRNYPYQGKSDGLTTFLRKRFQEDAYLGIELEINQKLPVLPPPMWLRIKGNIGNALDDAVRAFSLH